MNPNRPPEATIPVLGARTPGLGRVRFCEARLPDPALRGLDLHPRSGRGGARAGRRDSSAGGPGAPAPPAPRRHPPPHTRGDQAGCRPDRAGTRGARPRARRRTRGRASRLSYWLAPHAGRRHRARVVSRGRGAGGNAHLYSGRRTGPAGAPGTGGATRASRRTPLRRRRPAPHPRGRPRRHRRRALRHTRPRGIRARGPSPHRQSGSDARRPRHPPCPSRRGTGMRPSASTPAPR